MTAQYARPESVQAILDKLKGDTMRQWFSIMHTQLATLDPSAPTTLRLILGSIMANGIEQKEIAEILNTSRTQIARWEKGQNVPKQTAFRIWMVEKLLHFIKNTAETTSDPIRIYAKDRPASI